jgi:hypothetical protein
MKVGAMPRNRLGWVGDGKKQFLGGLARTGGLTGGHFSLILIDLFILACFPSVLP